MPSRIRPGAVTEAEKRPLKDSGRIGAKTLVPKRPRMEKKGDEPVVIAEEVSESGVGEELTPELKEAAAKHKREMENVKREEAKLKRETEYSNNQLRRERDRCKCQTGSKIVHRYYSHL